MSVGPLRRSVGALGLLALVPLAAMIVAGTLTPVDAARRATVTLVALLLLGRLAGRAVHHLATLVESSGRDADASRPPTPAEPAPTEPADIAS